MEKMSECDLCPRQCGADRAAGPGVCGAWMFPYVAKAALHMWEEPCISGTGGSGTLFLCGCNLNCVFCQNFDISHGTVGKPADAKRLAGLMLRLQEKGAHNVNLVTPAPHVHVVIPAIQEARRRGLTIPIVYNTNAYERVETLKRLEGHIEIYLPDFKYIDGRISEKYSGAGDYFAYALPAIQEMVRQCGELAVDARGIAQRGVIIRHLVLPGSVDETRRVLQCIAQEFSKTTAISLMSQYVPAYRADFSPLNRKLLKREYERAVGCCLALGLQNVMIQELSSAKSEYTPAFDGSIL